MSKFFKNTQWNTTYNEAIRILEIPHAPKETQLIKSEWIKQFGKFGFQKVMEAQLDLAIKEQNYRNELGELVNFIEKLDILKSSKFSSHTVEEIAQIVKDNQTKALKQLKKLSNEKLSITQEYENIINEWKKYENIYKKALLCYTSTFYHPQSELFALKLTYSDLMFSEPEQIEMCYELSKRQRKQLSCNKKTLPSIKYATNKLTSIILNNEQVLNSSMNKKHSINRQKTA